MRILVEDGHYVSTQAPRLTNLLKTLGHRVEIVVSDAHEFPANSFVVADRQHFLFRPNSVHSAGLLDFENPAKSAHLTQILFRCFGSKAGSGYSRKRWGSDPAVSGAGDLDILSASLSFCPGFAHWGGLR